MKRTNLLRLAAVLLLIGSLVSVVVAEGYAQSAGDENAPSSEGRSPEADLFGGSSYTGGHLKYSYKVSREGVDDYSITTTEIIPQDDGMYRVESSSTNVVGIDGVNIGFFGIPLRGLGFRIPTSTGGTVDLSPLSSIESEVLEPNQEYVLPDGGYLTAGELGTIAGLDVIYATYTHADFANVEIQLALPVDVGIRNMLPIFPYLELKYSSDELPEEGADSDYERMRSFSQIELIEFVYEP